MKVALGWHWPQGAALAYCVKAATATLLGYLLSVGGAENAVYGAFSAALIVGASRGEDVSTGANRVRGSLAGMLAGIALAYAAVPPALAVALGIGVTAYLCMGCGWGVPAARIGASLCAVTVLMHGQDALGYSAMRIGNTLIGIAAGLAVSYLVLPVRGADAVARATEAVLAAVADLLTALGRATQPLPIDLHVAVLDRMAELEKAVRDARREFGRTDATGLPVAVREVGMACAGALTAALAHADLCASPAALAAARPLQVHAEQLAERARRTTAATQSTTPAEPALLEPDGATGLSEDDAVALQGLNLGLRKIAQALAVLGV